MADLSCPGDSANCHSHFHDEDPRYLAEGDETQVEHNRSKSTASTTPHDHRNEETSMRASDIAQLSCNEGFGIRGIIRNFTPSYVERPPDASDKLLKADNPRIGLDGSL
jgi:hypothetical protein